jgi:thiol-disulfide isomerase/thioredoxin
MTIPLYCRNAVSLRQQPGISLVGWVILLALTLTSASAGTRVGMALPTGFDMQILQYPASGKRLLIWVPSKRGVRPGNEAFGKTVQAQDIDHWLLDLHSSYLAPTSAQAYETFEPRHVADVIDAAVQQGWSEIIVGGESRGAALAMQAARLWQLDNPGNTAVRGLLLFHPYLIDGQPQAGELAELLPIASATNLPTYVVQPELNTKYLLSRAVLEHLESGGAPVYMHIIADVRGGYHVRDQDRLRPAELVARRQLGSLTRTAIEHLLDLPTPTQAAVPTVPATKPRKNQTQGTMDAETPLTWINEPRALPLLLPDQHGRLFDLDTLRGQVVMVNFWATWCAPCVKEIASLIRLGDHFEDRPFRIVAVNLNESTDKVSEFFDLRDIVPNFDTLFDHDGEAARKWRVYAVPSTYLVDADQGLRYGHRGAKRWDAPEIIALVEDLLRHAGPDGAVASDPGHDRQP